VFSNLLVNAAKFTDHGGHVAVSAEQTGTVAVVRVRDDGIGLSPESLVRVFDLFVQEDVPVDYRGGLGLGLALVRKVVDLHGGWVEAHSAGRGQGSEFVVMLPALP